MNGGDITMAMRDEYDQRHKMLIQNQERVSTAKSGTRGVGLNPNISGANIHQTSSKKNISFGNFGGKAHIAGTLRPKTAALTHHFRPPTAYQKP